MITKAQEIHAILLSLNGDFADLVAYPPENYQGIIALQMRNHPEILPHLQDGLLAYLRLRPDPARYRGKFVYRRTQPHPRARLICLPPYLIHLI